MESSRPQAKTTSSIPFPEIDFCSVGKERGPNEDYVLYEEQTGVCVADGISGAPLGDAVARYACHAAMQALRDGESTRRAIMFTQEQVSRFIADIDSPRSGASIVVAKLDGGKLEASWAGDTAVIILRRDADKAFLISSLDLDAFTSTPPLGNENHGEVGSLSLPLDVVNAIAICTNGAWRAAGVERIGALLAENTTARKAVARIVFGHQSRDDSTALVARFHNTLS